MQDDAEKDCILGDVTGSQAVILGGDSRTATCRRVVWPEISARALLLKPRVGVWGGICQEEGEPSQGCI